ncbi:uncharacterized protein LOC100377888 [Saccoglossus kowalevskii]|uniref:Plant intracellular Ras-group-related LRR protein 4-like n=1 Tax=Saccoglossus kowalevskii TaxID=10224 RepID=A0ABM0GWU1_SACKO|nr:PREDICTED: plant intracellular Ras-group-related LRR protein 4-like [Saccoglossus kowalevskii]
MKYNALTAIPDAIGKLKSMKILKLDVNEIEKIPDSLCALEQLTKLNMGLNALTAIPDEIGKLKSMKILKLYYNNIEKIPDSLCALEQLTELNMKYNALTAIPDEIGKLKSMKILKLYYNNIEKIPDSLCALEQLTKLNMKCNALTSIPDEISKLKRMKTLNLSENKIEKIPDSLCALEQLTELNMEFNALTAIPSGIKNLKLRLLRLNNNKLKEFPWQIIEELPSLHELSLCGNELQIVPDHIGRLLRHRPCMNCKVLLRMHYRKTCIYFDESSSGNEESSSGNEESSSGNEESSSGNEDLSNEQLSALSYNPESQYSTPSQKNYLPGNPHLRTRLESTHYHNRVQRSYFLSIEQNTRFVFGNAKRIPVRRGFVLRAQTKYRGFVFGN